MRKLRSILAAVMAVMLILTAVPFTASAADIAGFSDFPTGWSYAAMTDAVNNGLLTGYGDGTIRPQERLTRAQMAAIINRAFGAEIKADIAGKYGDVNPGDWFYDDIAKAVNMKTFAGDDSGNMRPNEPITREDAMVVISRALVVSSMGTELLYNYTDRDTVDGYAEAAVCAFLDRHYVQGYGDGTIRGRNYITREEFAQIMDNIFAAYVRVGGVITLGNSEGEVIITGDNIGAGDTVRISSSYIDGDLIIGDGLSTADIIIENVDVKGRILLRGGEGTVTFKNVKLGTLIVTNDVNGTVNFMHYSDEALFKNAVYNTPATFLDRTVDGGSASGTGRLNHDTTRVGNKDAGTGPKDDDKKNPIIVVPGGGGTVANYYTVNFRYEDGTLITGATYNVRSGSTLAASKIPAIPAKTGYDAKYWYYYATDSDKIHDRKTEFTSTVKVTDDIDVYPFYEKHTYTVTFDPDNGESATTVGVKYDETATLPTAPTKEGFVFGGWFYTEGGVEKEFTDSTKVTGDITVKAKWTVETHTVIFKNGADEYHKIENIPYNTTVTLPAAPTAPAGQTFVGWFYTENGVEKEFTASTKVTADLTVTAKWDGIKYTVTFDPDNGEASTVISDIAYNATVTLPTAPTKEGFVFGGWFYTEGGAEKEFTSATPVTDNITVKAKWTVETHTVIFKNGADEYHKIENIPYNTTVTLPAAPTAPAGQTFVGWFYTENGVEKEFTASTKVTADLTVTAKWDGIKYTVTFDPDNGEASTVISDIAYNATVTLPTAPTKEGFVFGGWFYTEGGAEKEFTSATPVTDNITVKAKWTTALHTVIFMDGATEYDRIENIPHDTTVTLPTAPTKEGFVFGGWFYTEGGVEKEFTDSTKVVGDLTVTAKWIGAKYTVIFMDGTSEYHKIEDVPYDTTVTLPTEPTKEGFTFGGWFDEHGNEFTSSTKVTADITVYANWIGKKYTVTFWEIDEERNKVEDIASGEKVADADITTATDALDEAELAGYVANKSNISATYDKDVKHMVPGDWYFKEGTEWKKFDSTIAVYRDLDVYYMFTFLKVHLNLSSYLGTAGNIAVDVPYAPDTEAVKSVLDGLYLANSSAVLAMQKVLGEAYGRSINAFGVSYTPVGDDGKLGNFTYNYRLINLLGEETIRRYTKESIEDMILNDKALLTEGIKTVASHLGNTSSSEYTATVAYLKTADGKNLLRSFMNDNEDFWIDYLVETPEGRAILLPYLRTLLPGYTDEQITAMIEADPEAAKDRIRTNKATVIEYVLSDDANLASMIEQACKTIGTDSALRDNFAEKAADTIYAAADKDSAFVDRAVEVASAAYEDKIEEFIASLKNDDTFLVDADRKFIILALSKKLTNTTYDEIKAKLPSAIFKVLDDAVAKDIFDKTLDAYRTQVDAVKAIVTDPAYDGTKQYVDTCCLITVDPVEQVLIPEYDRFFVGKIDPAIKDNKYYTLNPYIAEIEQLLKVESVLDKKSDGYYVRSASDYYALIYKLAVLSTDVGTWFVDNVPENELDDAIEATASRIGGYLDRLIDKVTFLQNGKVDEARNRAQDLVRKLIDKNNSDLWNTATETAFTDKLPVAYDKAKDLIYDKLGFDVDNTVIVTIGSDNETVTVTDGVKTVTKKLSDLLKQYADGKKGISVDGTVITVKGKSIDAAKIVAKLTAKFGSTFTVTLERGADNTEYKLTVNSDYVLIQKILK